MVRVAQKKKSKAKSKDKGDETKGAARAASNRDKKKGRSLAAPTSRDSAFLVADFDDLTPEQQEAHRGTFGSQDIASEPEDAPGGDRREGPSPEKSRSDRKKAIKKGELTKAEAKVAEANIKEEEEAVAHSETETAKAEKRAEKKDED